MSLTGIVWRHRPGLEPHEAVLGLSIKKETIVGESEWCVAISELVSQGEL